jgi:ABC-2 type transport system ATP-binding protein/lipopolysaccharide transport system ATP-binding protein
MEKAKMRMTDLIHRSDILVLSTHAHQTIKEFCNKVLWLEKGHIKSFGEIDEVLEYHKAYMAEVELENAAPR